MPFEVKYNIPPTMLEEQANLGEGISRPPLGAQTRLYKLLVKSPGSPAMTVTMRAETPAKARKYAGNCWPNATIEMVRR